MLVALTFASLVGLVSTRTADALENHQRAKDRSVPALSTAAPSVSTPSAINPTRAKRPGDPEPGPSGNISVAVPVVPRLQALPSLCTAFLNSDIGGKNGSVFQVLIEATGGNAATTVAWCETYLTLWKEGKTGER